MDHPLMVCPHLPYVAFIRWALYLLREAQFGVGVCVCVCVLMCNSCYCHQLVPGEIVPFSNAQIHNSTL